MLTELPPPPTSPASEHTAPVRADLRQHFDIGNFVRGYRGQQFSVGVPVGDPRPTYVGISTIHRSESPAPQSSSIVPQALHEPKTALPWVGFGVLTAIPFGVGAGVAYSERKRGKIWKSFRKGFAYGLGVDGALACMLSTPTPTVSSESPVAISTLSAATQSPTHIEVIPTSVGAGPTEAWVRDDALNHAPPIAEQIFQLGAGATQLISESAYKDAPAVQDQMRNQADFTGRFGVTQEVYKSNDQWAVVASRGQACLVPVDSDEGIIISPYFRPDWATNSDPVVADYKEILMIPDGGTCMAIQVNSHWRMVGVKDGLIYTVLDLRPDGSSEVVINPEAIPLISQELVRLGANPNDTSTWEKTVMGTLLRDIAEDPNTKSRAALELEHRLVTEMRKGHFKELLSNPNTHAEAIAVLSYFVNAQYRVDGWNNLSQYSEATASNFIDILTPQQMLFLEMDLQRNRKEPMKLSILEVIATYEDQNNKVLWSYNFGDRQQPKSPSGGWYGMWQNGSLNPDFSFDKPKVTTKIFGQDVTYTGIWLADKDNYDYCGYIALPYGRTGMAGCLRGPDGVPRLGRIFEVVLNSQNPITVSSFPYESGGWALHNPSEPEYFRGWDAGATGQILPLPVQLKTQFAVEFKDKGFSPLTDAAMREFLSLHPHVVVIHTPAEHQTDAAGKVKVQSVLIDPTTGLWILGSTVESDRAGFQVGAVFSKTLKNSWPFTP